MYTQSSTAKLGAIFVLAFLIYSRGDSKTLDTMNSVCLLCDRSFRDDGALQQHKRDSPAHAQSFDCSDCNKFFGSEEALQQHLRDSPAHAQSFDCDNCNRSFGSEEALQQHLQNSPAHVQSFDCGDCNKVFGSDEALQQHLRDSPAHAQPSRSEEAIEQPPQDSPTHAQPFDCDDCNRSFSNEEALQQHLHNSSAHAQPFHCKDCNKSFGSDEALKQHLRDSPAHQEVPETPLDTFFRSFQTFQYDSSQPPATSYARLEAHKGWQRGERTAASSDAWDRYQHALEEELRLWFGEEDDLAAWHALCHAIGIEPPPQTCVRCEQVCSHYARLQTCVLTL
jgi:ribosomal protein S26